MTARLKITYEKEIVTKLLSKLSLKNKHEAPKITKIILNMGLGEDASDGKKLKSRSMSFWDVPKMFIRVKFF